jgi:hypothetical protein
MQFLEDLSEAMRTQDGMDSPDGPTHATAFPIYMVQQKVREYGTDLTHGGADGQVYIVDGEVYDEREEALEAEAEYGLDPCGEVTEIDYRDRWELVEGAVSFSRAAMEQFIQAEAHNLNEPRLYVASIPRRLAETRRLWELLQEGPA